MATSLTLRLTKGSELTFQEVDDNFSNLRTTADGAMQADGSVVATGKQTFRTAALAEASVRLPHGSAPTTPVSGDLWSTTGGPYMHVNGVTQRIFHDGYHPNADTLTTARNIALGGDLSGSASFDGSANITITATVADDSHNHIIANVDGLQTALDGKQDSATALTTSTNFSGDVSGTWNSLVVADDSHNHIIGNVDGLQTALDGKLALAGGTMTGKVTLDTPVAGNASATFPHGVAPTTPVNGDMWTTTAGPFMRISAVTQQLFHDGYHPNADTLTTARNIALGGDVTGSASFDGSSNITITAAVVDDSHNHIIGNVDGLQAALDGKAALASPALTGTPTAPTAAVGTNTTQLATTAFVNAEIANDAPTKTGGGASGSWGISITGSAASATGNAGSATVLQTGRTINGTSFNGSANITTANWGTSRTLTIGGTGKAVNGSANITWTLGEIGAQAANANLDTYVANPLAAGELTQLQNIGATTISATQWGYLGVMNQNVRTTDAVTFATVNTGQGAVECYAMNQAVRTTDTVTFGDITTDGLLREQDYSLTGTVIDPANGTIQYKTLSANTTFTESLANGDTVLLMIDDGTAFTITWPTITWLSGSGSAPTLQTTGYTAITLFQMAGTLYGYASNGA